MQSKMKKAVALKYDFDTGVAPKVKAKGQGIIAENIIEEAKKNSVPIYQNKPLTQMLMVIEIEQEIPPDLYQAVAEVLSYVYRTEQILAAGKRLRASQDNQPVYE